MIFAGGAKLSIIWTSRKTVSYPEPDSGSQTNIVPGTFISSYTSAKMTLRNVGQILALVGKMSYQLTYKNQCINELGTLGFFMTLAVADK